LLDNYRKNLFAAGTYYLRKADYKQSFKFFESYIDCASQPLFSTYRYDSIDTRMPEAAYWATYSAYRLQDPVLTLRHRNLALRDSSKAQYTLRYMAEARHWLDDDELYLQTLEEGFRRFPTSTYFFPRLMDSYTSLGRLELALAACDSALAICDSCDVFLFAKSTTLLRLERYGESIKVSDRLLQLNAYIDYFYFPWKRYLASAPGDGYDLLSQLTYSPGDNVFFFRYRQKSKDRDSHVVDGVRRQVQHRFRLSADIRISPQWRSKSVADLTVVAHDSTSAGWMLSQSVTWQPLRPLQLTLGAAYFHTDNYATRIYASERNLLYAFSFPSFYGRGVRLSFFGRCALSRSLLFIARVGHTRYFDREVIGSGLQQINSKRKTDVDLQLRCTF
jgi:tetratricopeptide (TPR) repeat protein